MMKTNKNTVTTSATATSATAPAAKTGRLGTLLGHSICSVICAMGKHGFSFDKAQLVLQHQNIKISPATIKTSLRCEKYRTVAPVSKAQLNKLAKAAK